jgi:cobalt-zinc-cadmium efflux system protein
VSHDHAHHHHAHGRNLALTLAITLVVLAAEAIGGWWSHSLALLSDAAHMLTDAASLAISLAAVRIARRPADARRSFGYHRFEILAALANALLLLAAGAYILFEAWRRLHAPPEIHAGPMLWVAAGALVANGFSMSLLFAGKDSNLNVKGAYLEVFSDMLGAAGVIVGALVIRFTGWSWVDSAVAVAIGLWVLPRTWALLHESLNVLLEGVPRGLELASIERALREQPGVRSVHDLHVWSIASGRPSLTAHVLVQPDLPAGDDTLLRALRTMLVERFDLHHSTLQIERTPCAQGDAAEQGHRDPCWPQGSGHEAAATAGHDHDHGHGHKHGHDHGHHHAAHDHGPGHTHHHHH